MKHKERKECRARRRQLRKARPRMSRKERFLKLFGFLYYPAQYGLVRLFYFGWVSQPSLEQIYYAFKIGGIIDTALSFVALVPAVLTIQHVFILIPIAVFVLVLLLWACRNIIIFMLALLSLCRWAFMWLTSLLDRLSITLDKQVVIHNGAPGTGKTWMLVLVGEQLARLMWRKLSYIHWRDKPKVKKWEKQGNEQKLSDWAETKIAFDYYITPQTVEVNGKQKTIYPARSLFSNIGVYVRGRMSSRLNFDHAAQLARLPAFTVSLWTEFGATYSIEYSSDKLLPMSDDLRFCRQYRENIIMGDEQEATNSNIDARRVVTDILLMTSCKRVLKPFLLRLVYEPLRRLFGRIQKFGKIFSPFMSFLEGLINACGFVKFKYEHEGSDMHARQGKRRRNSLIFPVTPEIQYDTRAFRNLYDCRDVPLDCHVHTGKTVENTPENRQAYLRAEYESRPRPDNDIEAEEIEGKMEFWKKEINKAKIRQWEKDYPEAAARYKSRDE